jgi:pimeloyl-ACP methyl ester carboxylesterase
MSNERVVWWILFRREGPLHEVVMSTLIVIAALLLGGAVVTFIAARLIEHAHPPRGRFIEIDGLRQHVHDLAAGEASGAPSRTAVVLLHGAACNMEDMRLALAERLGGRYRLILVDRPGLGWSQRRRGAGSSPAEQATVLCGVLDRLGIDRLILVGHSWGGALALTLALDHPQRLDGLVLIAPPVHPWLPVTTAIYSALAAPVFGPILAHTLALPLGALFIGLGFRGAFYPQLLPSGYLRRAAALLVLRPATFLANAADIGHLEAFLKQQAARYSRLTTSTIILAGDRDTIVSPLHHSMELAAAVPHAKLEVLPGLGHMLHHAAADRVIAAIDELAVVAQCERVVAAP